MILLPSLCLPNLLPRRKGTEVNLLLTGQKLPVYQDADLCTPCGGKCCKQSPGLMSPEDAGLHEGPENLKALLVSKRYVLDWYDGDPQYESFMDPRSECSGVYRLRPIGATPSLGYRGVVDSAFFGGRCTFHTDAGCGLPREEMPTQCKGLQPIINNGCTMPKEVNTRSIALAWLPYQNVVRAILDSLPTEY